MQLRGLSLHTSRPPLLLPHLPPSPFLSHSFPTFHPTPSPPCSFRPFPLPLLSSSLISGSGGDDGTESQEVHKRICHECCSEIHFPSLYVAFAFFSFSLHPLFIHCLFFEPEKRCSFVSLVFCQYSSSDNTIFLPSAFILFRPSASAHSLSFIFPLILPFIFPTPSAPFSPFLSPRMDTPQRAETRRHPRRKLLPSAAGDKGVQRGGREERRTRRRKGRKK